MKQLRSRNFSVIAASTAGAACLLFSSFGYSQTCNDLPAHGALQAALQSSVYGGPSGNGTAGSTNGGFDLDMWATLVNRDGEVCAVAFSGNVRGDQWPGSRVISAQKANTANAFSLPGLALSTANLYAATQPGGSLFGLQHSNPVDTILGYGDNPTQGGDSGATNYGLSNDPMNDRMIGGVNVFGGGLALYAADGTLLGAVGVSGDSSCADHNIAWRVRDTLDLDYVPGGVGSPADNIVFDIVGNGRSKSSWGHPTCNKTSKSVNNTIAGQCPISDGTTVGCLN